MSQFKLAALTAKLDTEEGIRHAVLQSILNWGKAQQNDPLEKDQSKRGWWAEEFVSGIGNRDWTLSRQKQTKDTKTRAKHYTEQCVNWLLEEEHIRAINVTCHYKKERLNRLIVVTLLDGTTMEINL